MIENILFPVDFSSSCVAMAAYVKRATAMFGGVLAQEKKEFADRERKAIEAALAECQGRVSGPRGAAAKLGIPHQTLESKIATLGIDKRRFKVLSPTPGPA